MHAFSVITENRFKKQLSNYDRQKAQMRKCCEKLPIMLEFSGGIKILVPGYFLIASVKYFFRNLSVFFSLKFLRKYVF